MDDDDLVLPAVSQLPTQIALKQIAMMTSITLSVTNPQGLPVVAVTTNKGSLAKVRLSIGGKHPYENAISYCSLSLESN